VSRNNTDTERLFVAIRSWLDRHYPGNTRAALTFYVPGDPDAQRLGVPPITAGYQEVRTEEAVREEEEAAGQPRHSPDFRSVFARGKSFSFSPAQASIVKQLWDALENDTPAVGQELLLEAAGSESKRLRDLFRKGDGTMHAAWGILIVPDTKGTFRLDLGG
jgi:hypothetical protein